MNVARVASIRWPAITKLEIDVNDVIAPSASAEGVFGVDSISTVCATSTPPASVPSTSTRTPLPSVDAPPPLTDALAAFTACPATTNDDSETKPLIVPSTLSVVEGGGVVLTSTNVTRLASSTPDESLPTAAHAVRWRVSRRRH